MNAYLVEAGVLLNKGDAEFESYNTVYDSKYGYYDEDQYYMQDESTACSNAREYVGAGVDNTYAIVTLIEARDGSDFNSEVKNNAYSADMVIYSIAKMNGNIVENFVGRSAC